MSILDLINNKEEWKSFYNYKIEKGHLNKKEEKELKKFIDDEEYLDFSSCIKDEKYNFKAPKKILVNKIGSDKKRVVYCYDEKESIILKFITHHLSRYDYKMANNCYSFRRVLGVKKAISTITKNPNIDNMYAYKVDIKNYFNSIDVDKLLIMLNEVIDDKETYNFISKLLTFDKSIIDGQLVEEKRGAMAGVSFAPFLANVYLMDLDKYFEDNNILYARYSDDIIVFASSLEELNTYKKYINDVIFDKGLTINKDKEFVFNKGEEWNFLGIKYHNKKVDLSDITVDKIKGKIRRKARAIHRRKLKKNMSSEDTIKAMTKVFNYKFFDMSNPNDLTWSRWFFPLINTDESLKVIDEYLQMYLRYAVTGKHNKANFRIRYSKLKECGYRSLVNEYYKEKVIMKDFTIDNKVNARIFKCNGENNDVLVAIHGFTGSKRSSSNKVIGEALSREGFDVITFDLPRHGDNSKDTPIRYSECIETLKIVDSYVKENYKGKRISYIATSYGGYLLLNMLNDTNYEYHKIILRVPAIFIDEVFSNVIFKDNISTLKDGNILDVEGIKIDEYYYNELLNNRLIDKYSNNTRFLNIIQGKKDDTVDYLKNEIFYENNCKDNYKIYYFENSGHSFKTEEEHNALLKVIREIFEY